ncbi:LbetaH domain-containing protein [Kaistia algarum]|uniref:putative colanic acid biosynthesis acetyltransferase n=1 Tax=Kaistia algarum TaxID=2083279 RepID=UPI001A9C62C8|nr:putative colanic acid biosynthesis acetyltransferase [Kaistia algarum]MCX5516786.1 putative colanic acid biosynthesis acetyltransferase [Kaistia algarum]
MSSKLKTETAKGVLDASKSGGVHGGAYFSLKHRLFRAVWNVVWLVFASWTPPPLHPWRRFLLRLFGAKIGKRTRIYGSARIWYPPNLEMGDYSVLGWKVNCYSQGKIVLEDYANVAQYVHLVTGSHDIDDPSFQLYTKPIRICRHAWIASDAFVGPGVTVHEGAVLGGRAVAFRDLDAWTVYVGNPARVVRPRKRFDL